MLFTIAAALTLGPALLTVGSLFGLFDPRRLVTAHLCRRIGASEMLMVESDHDMRNSADFISLDRVAKSSFDFPASRWCRASPGPWADHWTCHASLPVHHTRQRERPTAPIRGAAERQHRQAGPDRGGLCEILKKVIDLTQQMSNELHSTVLTIEDLQQVTDEMNSGIANLDDFLRPLKNYFYWEPDRFGIPLCWAFDI